MEGWKFPFFLAVVVPSLTPRFTQGRAVCSFQIVPSVFGGPKVLLGTAVIWGSLISALIALMTTTLRD